MAELPAEIWLKIMSFLDINDILFGISNCSRRLYAISYDRRLWTEAIETKFLHLIAKISKDLEEIQDLRSWYLESIDNIGRVIHLMEEFVKSRKFETAMEICSYGCIAIPAAHMIKGRPPTLTHYFWANWFAHAIPIIEGARKLVEGGRKLPLEDPLDACLALEMLCGNHELLIPVLEFIDDKQWKSMDSERPLETLERLITEIDNLNFNNLILKASLFCYVCSHYHLLQTSILHLARVASSTYVCVYLSSENICFIDFAFHKAKIRTLEEMRDRVNFFGGATQLQDGITLDDLITTPIGSRPDLAMVADPVQTFVYERLETVQAILYPNLLSKLFQNITKKDVSLKVEPRQRVHNELCGKICAVGDDNYVVLDFLPDTNCYLCHAGLGGGTIRVPQELLKVITDPIDVMTVKGLVVPNLDLNFIDVGEYFEFYDQSTQTFRNH